MLKRCVFALSLLALPLSASEILTNFSSFDIPGGTNPSPEGINSAGTVVGGYNVGSLLRGFTLANNTITAPIIAPGDTGGFTLLFGINDSGEIAGEYLGNNNTYHGFLKVGSNYTTIDHTGPYSTALTGINNAGNYVGTYGSSSAPDQGFIVINHVETDFAIGHDSFTYNMNNSNDVVGQYHDSMGVLHAFVRAPNGTVTTLVIPGSTSDTAHGINDAGTIVGSYVDSNNVRHGFVDLAGTIYTVDVAGAEDTAIRDINDSDMVIGYYVDAMGIQHGFEALLSSTSVPEPSTWALLGVGLCAVIWRRRSKHASA